jgi:hypothetical protein
MPTNAQSTSPADGSAESYDANEAAGPPPEAIRLGLTFPGVSLAEFNEKYVRGALAAVSRVSGVEADAISATYTPAAGAASPESSRRKLVGRRLAQADGGAGGVAALYALSATDRDAALQRLDDASANDGEGFAAALAGEGVPIRPEVSVNGVVKVALHSAAAPAPSPAPKEEGEKDKAAADKEAADKAAADKSKDKEKDKGKDGKAAGKPPAPAPPPSPPPAQVAATARGNKAGVIVGAVVSGLVGALLLALAVVLAAHHFREKGAKKAKKAAPAAADVESGWVRPWRAVALCLRARVACEGGEGRDGAEAGPPSAEPAFGGRTTAPRARGPQCCPGTLTAGPRRSLLACSNGGAAASASAAGASASAAAAAPTAAAAAVGEAQEGEVTAAGTPVSPAVAAASAASHPQAFLPELPESSSAGGAGTTGGGASGEATA